MPLHESRAPSDLRAKTKGSPTIDPATLEPPDGGPESPREPRATSALRLLRRAHLHELRGELNALRLQVTLLQRRRDADPERLAGWIEDVAGQARALELGLEEMSALEHLEEQLSDATVVQVASRVAELLGPLADHRRITLSVDGSPAATETDRPGPGLARRLLKLGARCLAVATVGTVVRLKPTTGGVALSWSEGAVPDDELDAVREGIHSEDWSVERSSCGLTLTFSG